MWISSHSTVPSAEFLTVSVGSTTYNPCSIFGCPECAAEQECRCEDCRSLDEQDISYYRENRERLHPRLLADLERLERKWPEA